LNVKAGIGKEENGKNNYDDFCLAIRHWRRRRRHNEARRKMRLILEKNQLNYPTNRHSNS
jgi:hypothetical protein